ncbi:MAG: glycosyltransferase [Acidobacteriota bacterium]
MVADSPLVSVIITCFNGARWIPRAVESVLAQTYPDYEIMIVDDGSGPDTIQVLSGLSTRHDRIKVRFNGENLGIPATKNIGLKHARGDYFAFLEQDDRWKPTKLQRQISAMTEKPLAGMAFTNAEYVHDDGQVKVLPRPVNFMNGPTEAVLRRLFLWNPVPSMSSVVLTRSCVERIGDFDERLNGADDYDYWLRVAAEVPILYVDEPLVEYTVHQHNYSVAAVERMLTDRIEVVRSAAARHSFLQALLRQRLGAVYRSTAAVMLESGRRREALHCVLHSLRSDPRAPRSYLLLALILAGKTGRFLQGKARDALRPGSGIAD